jgi:acyl-CoA reductase-like NAD-dependent aldehyde dehydrogenase
MCKYVRMFCYFHIYCTCVVLIDSFGPVVSLSRVPAGSSDETIAAMLNHSEFGLTGGVFSTDRERAERIMSQLNVGSAYWNCCGAFPRPSF